jgi:dTDP-glucose 4,6-dehydratase
MSEYLQEKDKEDLILELGGLTSRLANSSIFITGGTGFFGKWLLNSIKLMNAEFNANINAIVLSRNPASFLEVFPHLKGDPAFEFQRGDLLNFDLPTGKIDFVIHAASIVHSPASIKEPLETLKNIVDGTRNILELARKKDVKAVLLTSSGAVYGKQPAELERINESYMGGPDYTDPSQAYHEGKRLAELLAASYCSEYGLNTKIARCFAFIGPHLPLDGHFAAGNFIRDVLQDRDIKINGDGTPVRSYMYPTDLVLWLWTILLEGKPARAYNVGSPIAVNLFDMAQTMQKVFRALTMTERNSDVIVSKQPEIGVPANRYVPCINRSKNELNLQIRVSLEEGLRRTFGWYQGFKI